MGTFDAYKQQVIDACHILTEQGYLSGTGGNVSVRVAEQPAMAVTPSNTDYSTLTLADICIVDWSLTVIEGALKPSVESGMHAAVYQTRADVGSVIHTHQPYASAISLINKPIPALYDEQARFLGRSVEIVEYAPSGTGWLKSKIAKRVKSGSNAYILQNHGVLILASTVDRAIFNVGLLEKCALTYLLALSTGEKVNHLNPAIREIILGKLRKDQAQAAHHYERLEPIPAGQQSNY